MKITEENYDKIKKWVIVCCAIGIITYVLLIKWLATVNPAAFTYTPGIEKEPGLFKIQRQIWWAIIFSAVVIIILTIREMRNNPNHWLRKIEVEINDEGGKNNDKTKENDVGSTSN